MYRKQRALTLLELMFALAILSIIGLIAIPTWQSTLVYGRRAAALNALRSSLALARSAAITHGKTVDLCTSHDHHHCDNGDWDDGWIVFVDQDADYEHDDGERILHVNAALAESSHLRGNRLIAHHVGFQRYGMMHGVHNGTITYTTTPPRPALRRCLIVSRTGRTRAAEGENCH
ncbi:MAG: GspH/FimT family pseudopilin [Gammaproteobacteria bacterium]